MKKVLTTIVVIALSSMLGGCGEEPVEAPAAEIPYEDAYGIEENIDWGDSAIEGEVEAPIAEEQEEDLSWEENIITTPVESEPQPMGTAELEGKILVANVTFKGIYWTYNIFAMNPDDPNDYKQVRCFECDNDTNKDISFYNIGGQRISLNRHFNFTEDFTKFAVTLKIVNNGSTHAGWLDCAGNFVDVNVAVGDGGSGDFDEEKHFSSIGFTNKGRFVYREDESEIFYSVDSNTISDKQEYVFNSDDFIPVNQSFQDLGLGDSREIWAKFLSPDGSKVFFCSAVLEDIESASAIYMLEMSGGEPNKLRNLSSYVISLSGSGDRAVWSAAIVDWR